MQLSYTASRTKLTPASAEVGWVGLDPMLVHDAVVLDGVIVSATATGIAVSSHSTVSEIVDSRAIRFVTG